MNNLIRHVWPRVKHVEEVCVDMLCKFQLVLNINSAVRFHVYNIHVVDMSKMIFNASLFTCISAPIWLIISDAGNIVKNHIMNNLSVGRLNPQRHYSEGK